MFAANSFPAEPVLAAVVAAAAASKLVLEAVTAAPRGTIGMLQRSRRNAGTGLEPGTCMHAEAGTEPRLLPACPCRGLPSIPHRKSSRSHSQESGREGEVLASQALFMWHAYRVCTVSSGHASFTYCSPTASMPFAPGGVNFCQRLLPSLHCRTTS